VWTETFKIDVMMSSPYCGHIRQAVGFIRSGLRSLAILANRKLSTGATARNFLRLHSTDVRDILLRPWVHPVITFVDGMSSG
jgi:hypothetical protein